MDSASVGQEARGDDCEVSETTSTAGDATAPNLLAGRLRLSMVRLARQLRRMDPNELTITQFSALATVVRSGPLGVGQLAEIEGLPSPAATRLADKLEEAGLVARQPNPADRRGVQIVTTLAGAELLERRARIGNAWLAEQLSALSKADRLAVERAVAVLESFATERPGEQPGAGGGHHELEESQQ
jgi:DNA-binding MarR family transcriptional regulator